MNCKELNKILKGKVIKCIRGEFGDIRIEFEDESIFRIEFECYEEEEDITFSTWKYIDDEATYTFKETITKNLITTREWS